MTRPILIAGGGPVGIITALALAQRGVAVRLFEAADAVTKRRVHRRCIPQRSR